MKYYFLNTRGSIIKNIKISVRMRNIYTANASKLIEKHFLDLRNMFSNQENIKSSFSKQEKKLTEKNVLVPLQENLT